MGEERETQLCIISGIPRLVQITLLNVCALTSCTIKGRELAPRDGLAVICVYRSKCQLEQSTALVLLPDFTREAWHTFSKVSDLACKVTISGHF